MGRGRARGRGQGRKGRIPQRSISPVTLNKNLRASKEKSIDYDETDASSHVEILDDLRQDSEDVQLALPGDDLSSLAVLDNTADIPATERVEVYEEKKQIVAPDNDIDDKPSMQSRLGPEPGVQNRLGPVIEVSQSIMDTEYNEQEIILDDVNEFALEQEQISTSNTTLDTESSADDSVIPKTNEPVVSSYATGKKTGDLRNRLKSKVTKWSPPPPVQKRDRPSRWSKPVDRKESGFRNGQTSSRFSRDDEQSQQRHNHWRDRSPPRSLTSRLGPEPAPGILLNNLPMMAMGRGIQPPILAGREMPLPMNVAQSGPAPTRIGPGLAMPDSMPDQPRVLLNTPPTNMMNIRPPAVPPNPIGVNHPPVPAVFPGQTVQVRLLKRCAPRPGMAPAASGLLPTPGMPMRQPVSVKPSPVVDAVFNHLVRPQAAPASVFNRLGGKVPPVEKLPAPPLSTRVQPQAQAQRQIASQNRPLLPTPGQLPPPNNLGYGVAPQAQAMPPPQQQSFNAPAPPPIIKSNSETLKSFIVESLKNKRYDEALAKLQEGISNYPDVFNDAVILEIIQFCYKQQAIDQAVLFAQLVVNPEQKLLDFFAVVAEKNKNISQDSSDKLFVIFYRSLNQKPRPQSMMAFIKCFSALKCWSKLWTAVEQFAPRNIIPIEGMVPCFHHLAHGNGVSHLPVGVKILVAMSTEDIGQVSRPCIDKLWLRCAQEGFDDCVRQVDAVRRRLPSDEQAQERIAAELQSYVMETVMGGQFRNLATFVYALRSHMVQDKTLCEYVANAFSLTERNVDKFADFLRIMSEKKQVSDVSVDRALAAICLRQVLRSLDRQRFEEVLQLVKLMQSVRLEADDATELADLQLQAHLRLGQLEAAAGLVTGEGGGLQLAGTGTPEQLRRRTQLLQQMYESAAVARDPTRALVHVAAAALSGLLSLKDKDVDVNTADLNRQYNQFLTLCSQQEDVSLLKKGLTLVLPAQRNNLTIGPTVLRCLVLACFRLEQKADMMHFLSLGMAPAVDIYPQMRIERGPKKLCLPSDLCEDEIRIVLTNYFSLIKTHLQNLMKQNQAPDILEECDVQITVNMVGDRDRVFLQNKMIHSNERALMERLESVLTTPGNFYRPIPSERSLNSGRFSVRLEAHPVYHCVYYLDENGTAT